MKILCKCVIIVCDKTLVTPFYLFFLKFTLKRATAQGGIIMAKEVYREIFKSPFEKETIKNSIGYIKGKLLKYLD